MPSTVVWADFAQRYALTDLQIEQFKDYFNLLVSENEQYNLTAITDSDSIIEYHFADSLELGNKLDFSAISSICDVGTGAGFPGLALKIKYPHVSVVLIEVVGKKVSFLNMVISRLGLSGVEVYTQDWRTFLRKTEYPLQLFCARASLRPDELTRLFQGGCVYKNAQLVYWAAADWSVGPKEQVFFKKSFEYTVKNRQRKYALFSR